MIEKVISGGQSGADIAGLRAAAEYSIPTGGYMPKGYRTLDGPRPEYAIMYNLVELSSPNYPPRTERNVTMSDATLRFASDWLSPGEVCTHRYLVKYKKPHLNITREGMTSPLKVASYIDDAGFKVINIAGNSEKTSPGIEEWVHEFLCRMFRYLITFDSARGFMEASRERD